MNQHQPPGAPPLARLDFYAPESMRDWVDRQATKAGLARSGWMRQLISEEQHRQRGTESD